MNAENSILATAQKIGRIWYGIKGKSVCYTVLCGNMVRVGMGEEKFVLKFHNSETLSNVRAIEEIYRIACQYRLTPEVIPTVDDHLIHSAEGYIVSLHRWIDHEGFSEKFIEAVPERLADLHAALRTLGEMSLHNHIESTAGPIVPYLARYKLEYVRELVTWCLHFIETGPKQVVHNDLHRGNLLCATGQMYFLDFDSASLNIIASDVATCAYRVCQGNWQKMIAFVSAYNNYSTKNQVDVDNIWPFVAFHAIQRILFILIQNSRGKQIYLSDLDNQKSYLHIALLYLDVKTLNA